LYISTIFYKIRQHKCAFRADKIIFISSRFAPYGFSVSTISKTINRFWLQVNPICTEIRFVQFSSTYFKIRNSVRLRLQQNCTKRTSLYIDITCYLTYRNRLAHSDNQIRLARFNYCKKHSIVLIVQRLRKLLYNILLCKRKTFVTVLEPYRAHAFIYLNWFRIITLVNFWSKIFLKTPVTQYKRH